MGGSERLRINNLTHNQAAKEKLNRRVELNMTIKRLEVELAAILPSLYR
jgi:hypothetical protein